MKAILLKALLFGPAWLLLPGIGWVGNAAFEVQGEVSRTVHFEPVDAEDRGPFLYRFSITVDGERYLIRLVPSFGQTEPEERYIEVGFDGEQQYLYHRSGRRSGTTSDGVDHIVDLGFLSRVVVPVALADVTIPPLWFAFASGDSLRKAPPKKLVPLWLLPIPTRFRDQVTFPIRFDLLGGATPLPRRATIRSEGVEFAYDPMAGLRHGSSPPPYDKGFVLAEYFVSESTPLGTGIIPKLATYRQYGLVSSDHRVQHTLLYELNISVTNALDDATPDSFIPRIITKAAIQDSRLAGEADYAHTNWPNLNDPAVQYAFRKAEEANRNLKAFLGESTPWRLNRLIFFVTVAATALVVVVLRLRRKHNPQ